MLVASLLPALANSRYATMQNEPTGLLPVLIVGAGTVGHVLALVLLQNGIPARIIEKDSRYRVGQKGAGVFARTIEMHQILGTLDDFLKQAGHMIPNRLLHAKGQKEEFIKDIRLAGPAEPTPSKPYSQPRLFGQDLHDALLRSHIEKLGGKVELSTALKSFEQSADYVVARIVKLTNDGHEIAEEEVKARYLIGTDGGRSDVRKQAGITFLGESRVQDRFLVADIHLKGLDLTVWHMWGDPQSQSFTARAISPDSDVFNIIGMGRDLDNATLSSSREEFIKGFCSVTGLSQDPQDGLEFGDVVWLGKYEPNIRMVATFRAGRILIAGDAAHVHSPTGGQGLNTGFVDAMNLGWKLALVLKSLAPSTLLDTYSEERLPVVAAMLEKTTLLLNKTFSPGTDEPVTVPKRRHELHQLGVNYRSSSILVDDTPYLQGEQTTIDPYRDGEDGQVRAGDRAPDAPGLFDLKTRKSRKIFDFFKTTHHTILVFSPSQELSIRCFGTLDAFFSPGHGSLFQKVVVLPKGDSALFEADALGADVIAVEDAEGHAYAGYNVELKGLPIVIVRPDGWIGATLRNAEGVQKYLESVFSK